MDHALQTISYIADIGSVLVLMARRRLARRPASQAPSHKLYKMLCHVFHSEDVSSPAPGILVGGLALGGNSGWLHPLPEPSWPCCPHSVLPLVPNAGRCLPPHPQSPWPFLEAPETGGRPRTFPAPGPSPSPPPRDSPRQWLVSQSPEATGDPLPPGNRAPATGAGGLGPEDARGFGGPEGGGWGTPQEMSPIGVQAQLIAQAIGQAFSVAYSQFLWESGLDPSQVGAQQSQAAGPGHLHNGDLDHFSNSENCREVSTRDGGPSPPPPGQPSCPPPTPCPLSQVCIEKRRGEGLGVALVESGWGSLLPTAVIANLLHGGPAERSGALSIGDRLTAINGTSLVGLPLAACQAAVRVSPRRGVAGVSFPGALWKGQGRV